MELPAACHMSMAVFDETWTVAFPLLHAAFLPTKREVVDPAANRVAP
eukprot:CAMPEP_0204557778 /NCGR_PEP_ID=MMETSP0661-20131031/30584_1 /ASSEMBLY_ACC=CAM_ASM_000606 /TAXON_ID=109239 /ORGANISM="Alexandrium margalefi, Strain AMGDE01CS-322" /LENGTH=46 /DNA_ID= /DNA_START= /DNA_END= /DNA_ORIENTATION=